MRASTQRQGQHLVYLVVAQHWPTLRGNRRSHLVAARRTWWAFSNVESLEASTSSVVVVYSVLSEPHNIQIALGQHLRGCTNSFSSAAPSFRIWQSYWCCIRYWAYVRGLHFFLLSEARVTLPSLIASVMGMTAWIHVPHRTRQWRCCSAVRRGHSKSRN